MATFVKRGDKVQARVRVKGFPPQIKTFYSKTDAARWARGVEAAMASGTWSDPDKDGLTFARALLRYQRDALRMVRNRRSVESYMPRLSAVPFADKPLAAVQASDVAALRDAWAAELKPSSIGRYLVVLSALFTMARQDWGCQVANPIKDIRKPSAGRGRERRLFDAEEFERVLAQSDNAEFKVVSRLALLTAARQAEITSLRWEHIHLEQRTAHLPLTKNGNSRTIPLSASAVALLNGIKREQGAVFAISANVVARTWYRSVRLARAAYERECVEQAKVPQPGYLQDLHFHDLRHEAISRLHEQGFSTVEVAAVSGHRNLASLARYSHVKPSHLVQKLQRLEAAG